ncbi:heterokaryon incompatibility protein-domain-containing protein [Cadophora sp. MPI-SDFR-AT-0126]|nr:heterokaryon incompatibility protein-domain-containing protein [Leotiomycetes sp. MPI-SDFR-AT-0126]
MVLKSDLTVADLSQQLTSTRLSTEPHVYTRLEVGEIRIIELIADEKDKPLSCHLRHEKFDSMTSYVALSYTWGTEPADRTIRIDGKSLRITPNLEAALLEFRQEPRRSPLNNNFEDNQEPGSSSQQAAPLRIWIDAICINQADSEERNAQIKLMADIYRSASELFIWLGVESDDSSLAISLMISYAQEKVEGDNTLSKWKSKPCRDVLRKWYAACACLFEREWFYRAWIVQEYVLGGAPDTIFYCGGSQISGSELEICCKHFSQRVRTFYEWMWVPKEPNEVIESDLSFDSCKALVAGVTRWGQLGVNKDFVYGKHGKVSSLLFWLRMNRLTKATNPRDMIYCLLGLVDSSHYDQDALIIDYDASIQDIYASLVESIVLKTKKLHVLLAACNDRSTEITRTWIPDWSVPSNSWGVLGHFCGDMPSSSQYFTASGKSEANALFDKSRLTMTVTGVLCDLISLIGPVYTWEAMNSNPDTLVAFQTAYQVIWRWMCKKEIFGTEREAKESLWKAMLFCGGDNPKERTKSDLDRLGFEESFRSRYLTIGGEENKGLVMEPAEMVLLQDQEPDGRISSWFTNALLAELRQLSSSAAIILTEEGHVGKTSYIQKLKSGDLVCVMLGSDVPMALRQVDNHYEYVADIYLDGIMHGEAIQALENGQVQLQDFELH